jgi:hypothetical protein
MDAPTAAERLQSRLLERAWLPMRASLSAVGGKSVAPALKGGVFAELALAPALDEKR